MLSFFPLDVLDEIWDVIESISEGFLPTLMPWLEFKSMIRLYKCFACLALTSVIN